LTNRERHLKAKYGLSIEKYNQLLNKQNGKCAICEKDSSEFKQNLAVDHNHATGEIRGLLCSYCNHRLVGRHRDGNLLRKMADYVDGGTGWFVPKKKRTKTRKPK
jgi:DNA-directed RNA polymerase subunit RPC12/RpoP